MAAPRCVSAGSWRVAPGVCRSLVIQEADYREISIYALTLPRAARGLCDRFVGAGTGGARSTYHARGYNDPMAETAVPPPTMTPRHHRGEQIGKSPSPVDTFWV